MESCLAEDVCSLVLPFCFAALGVPRFNALLQRYVSAETHVSRGKVVAVIHTLRDTLDRRFLAPRSDVVSKATAVSDALFGADEPISPSMGNLDRSYPRRNFSIADFYFLPEISGRFHLETDRVI